MNTIYKSAAIIIENKKLLVTRSSGKSFFISPGGKKIGDETDQQTLIRELDEELSITVKESDFQDFGTYHAQAAGEENIVVQMHIFIVTSYEGTITPSHEVEELRWITSLDVENIELGSIFKHDVIPQLLAQNLID